MGLLKYFSDRKGEGLQDVRGSDNRLNVSARADTRGYYNSRDESESFTLTFEDASATGVSTLDHVVHLQNTKTDGKHMVIRSASVNAGAVCKMSIHTVTGTAGGGNVAATPFNLNQAGPARAATVTANTVVNSNSSPITGLTEVAEVDHVNVSADGHEEFRFQDQFRLGQDQAMVIRMDTGTDVKVFGVIFFYFETGK